MATRVAPDEIAAFAEIIARSSETGEPFLYEHHDHRFDGRLGRIRATGSVVALDPARPEAKTLIGVDFPCRSPLAIPRLEARRTPAFRDGRDLRRL